MTIGCFPTCDLPIPGGSVSLVRVYVQNCKTQQYLTTDGRWTEKLSEALPFANTIDATLHCTKARVDHAQVVMKFGRPELDVTLPVSDDCH